MHITTKNSSVSRFTRRPVLGRSLLVAITFLGSPSISAYAVEPAASEQTPAPDPIVGPMPTPSTDVQAPGQEGGSPGALPSSEDIPVGPPQSPEPPPVTPPLIPPAPTGPTEPNVPTADVQTPNTPKAKPQEPPVGSSSSESPKSSSNRTADSSSPGAKSEGTSEVKTQSSEGVANTTGAQQVWEDIKDTPLARKLRDRGVVMALAPVAMNNAFQKTGGSAAAYTLGLDIGVTRAYESRRRAAMRRGWGVVIDYTVGDEKQRLGDRLYAFRVGSYGSLHFTLGKYISLHGKIDPALRIVIDRGAQKPMMIGFDVGASVGGRIEFTEKLYAGLEIGPQFGALFGGDTNPGFTAALSTKLFAAWRFGKVGHRSQRGQPGPGAPADATSAEPVARR